MSEPCRKVYQRLWMQQSVVTFNNEKAAIRCLPREENGHNVMNDGIGGPPGTRIETRIRCRSQWREACRRWVGGNRGTCVPADLQDPCQSRLAAWLALRQPCVPVSRTVLRVSASARVNVWRLRAAFGSRSHAKPQAMPRHVRPDGGTALRRRTHCTSSRTGISGPPSRTRTRAGHLSRSRRVRMQPPRIGFP